jgi:phosphonate transport system substrate-binding protein
MGARSWGAVALAVIMIWACGRDPATPAGPEYGDYPLRPQEPVYRLAVHPLHNPERLFAAYQPLIDYLNQRLPDLHFALEASRDYQAYEAKFRQRGPELLLPNPWQTLEAMKAGYRVIGMAGDAEDFRGILVVRRDGGIRSPADLRGKVVAYPAPTALAACIMPQYYLHRHGVDVNRQIENRYVGSQESSIMNVYLGEAAAGATWPPPWRLFQRQYPREAAELMVAWETPPLVNNSVMVRNDVPPAVAARLATALVELDGTTEGREILAGMETARFHRADDARYAPVRDYVAGFEREVRAVEAR